MSQVKRFGHYHRWIRHTLEVALCLLLLAVMIHTALQDYHVNGESMEPTLHDQEYMLVNKTAYLFQAPQRGDVIVFQAPPSPGDDYVKRIVAIPGDIISVIDQKVIVDGVTLHENYINQNDPYNPYPPILRHILSANQYFVMGDNRGNSSDSRQWGIVPRANILGKVMMVYWPFNVDNFGILPNESNVFARVRD